MQICIGILTEADKDSYFDNCAATWINFCKCLNIVIVFYWNIRSFKLSSIRRIDNKTSHVMYDLWSLLETVANDIFRIMLKRIKNFFKACKLGKILEYDQDLLLTLAISMLPHQAWLYLSWQIGSIFTKIPIILSKT
jgi:hypothetical protein